MNRRSMLRTGGAATLGAMALAAVSEGNPAQATPNHRDPQRQLLPNPAEDPVPNPDYPRGLTAIERRHLETFDQLDFEVFTHADWARLGESHSPKIRVHWPDGHYTDGIDQHIADLAALFVWAPDTRIREHPLRIAHDDLTAVTGVMRGTFTRPMPDGQGGQIAPNGKAWAINMATVGIWNRRRGFMDEEFLFWDNQSFYQQLGLA